MPVDQLEFTLVGKDVSASQTFRNLARAATAASKVVSDEVAAANRKVEASSKQSAAKASDSWVSGFGGKISSWAQSGLTGILAGVTASVTSSVMGAVGQAGDAVLSQLKTSVIDYNSTLEQASIGFTTMLGSGSKATEFLGQLQAFAQKTPFESKDLINLSQQMMGYGIAAKNVIPYLTALGDASAASGRTDALPNAVLAFEQMAARGKVDLGDLNQLTQAGVPALKILAGAYGTTSAKILDAVHKSKLMSSQALPLLIAGIEKGTSKTAALGGMMDKQSKTFAGAMSNINDALNASLSSAFQPFFGMVEKGALAVQKFAQSDGFKKWAADTGTTVTGWMDKIGGAFNDLFSDPHVQAGFADLGDSIGAAMNQIGPALDRDLPMLETFGKDALPQIAEAIGGLIDKLPTLIDWFDRFTAGLAAAAPFIATSIRLLSDIAGTIINIVDAIGRFSGAIGGVKAPTRSQLSGGAGNGGGGTFGTPNSSVVGSSEDSAALSSDKALASQMGAALKKATSTTVPSIASLLGGSSSSGGGSTTKKKTLAEIFADFRTYGREAVNGVKTGILGSISDIRAAGTKMRDAVKEAFTAGYISKGRESALITQIKSTTTRLAALSKERATVLDRLASLRTDRTSMITSTRDATTAQGDIMNFDSSGSMIQNLQMLVRNAGQFKTDLTRLAKAGLDRTTFGQLVAGWATDPASALRAADELLANPVDMREIVTLQNSLGSTASALGTTAGDTQYNSRINAASGKSKVLTWQMQKTAERGLAKVAHTTNVTINLTGTYAGTNDALAKTVRQAIADAVKKGIIPKNWATA